MEAKQKIEEVIESLHQKFGQNITLTLNENIVLLEEAEIKTRAVYYLGEAFNSDVAICDTQKEITKIYYEIFTDLTIACYLSCCSIDNSPRSVLRRVLELGIATLYLWDLPYKYWNWSRYENVNNDLNFKEMLDYLNNQGYIDFINHQNSSALTALVQKESVNSVYRDLSNVIHGKTSNFESVGADSFSYNKSDLVSFLEVLGKVQNILLTAWKARFPKHFAALETNFTPLTRYKYEY